MAHTYCVVANDYTGLIVHQDDDKARAIHWAVANSKKASRKSIRPNASGIITRNVVAITKDFVVERVSL